MLVVIIINMSNDIITNMSNDITSLSGHMTSTILNLCVFDIAEEILELNNVGKDMIRWMFSSFAAPYLRKVSPSDHLL